MNRSACILIKIPLNRCFADVPRTVSHLLFRRRVFTDCLRFSPPVYLPSFLRFCSDISPIQSQKILCWKCGAEFDSNAERVNCSECGIIQPLDKEANFFTYLGVPLAFNLDNDELGKKFRGKQAIVHPDKFAMRSEDELQHSQQHSTFLNDAYRTLRDPFRRANYLLRLIEELDDDLNDPISIEFEKADDDLVLEIMELNEEIEMLENPDQIKQKIEEIDSKIDKFLASMNSLLHKKEIEEARKNLQWIKFLRQSRRLLERKSDREEETQFE
uniref:J domain-containing protein n=2 Tax=Meloidogyne TaxID=189290 RepID=A0A915NXP1_9BILA